MGAVVQLVEYRTRNREVASSTHTRSTASNLEQVANLLCAQANSDQKSVDTKTMIGELALKKKLCQVPNHMFFTTTETWDTP